MQQQIHIQEKRATKRRLIGMQIQCLYLRKPLRAPVELKLRMGLTTKMRRRRREQPLEIWISMHQKETVRTRMTTTMIWT